MKQVTLAERIQGAFLGKNIGGTLGMPYEGCETRLALTFFEPVPDAPVPNDDLDFQLVWLRAFEEHKLALDAPKLAEYWLKYIDVHWDEYGVALCNLRHGIKPPLSGIHNNNFTSSMGAAIRSEVWAAIFAGKPETAAWFAWQDAQVDHTGDGIYGEVYWAVLQSQLFAGGGLFESMDRALDYLPEESPLKRAFRRIDALKRDDKTSEEALAIFFPEVYSVSFPDLVMNCSIIYWALRNGGGDFDRSMLMAVNVGQDADCTAATVASCLGAYLGASAIPSRWLSAIGEEIKVGSYIKMTGLPATVSELSTQLNRLAEEMRQEKTPLPRVDVLPLQLEVPDDFSERRSFRVNGHPIEFDGIRLGAEYYADKVGEMLVFETEVEFPADGELALMVASRGLFLVDLDGKRRAVKGDQARPVPAVHRVRGGRVIPCDVKKGRHMKIRIEVYPTLPVPDLFVGFFDWNHRHVDVKWIG